MKNNILTVVLLTTIAFASSCSKDSTSISTPVTASSVEDMYTETSPMIQKPVTRTVNANIGGYLEAKPAHYLDHPKKNYPLIIFLHGQGEMGNGTSADLGKVANNAIPKLISKGTFPLNFNVHDTSFQFIVLSPQFKAWPQPSDVNDMIDFAEKNYRIDRSRVYVCGLSMGGGGTWDYTWNLGKRLTAIVPISGASWPTTQKGQDIAEDNVATWAFHNNNDPTVPSWYSVDYVQYINDYNPIVPAKLTLFNSNVHDAWTKATDPNYKENGQNIYEWMLSFKKRKTK